VVYVVVEMKSAITFIFLFANAAHAEDAKALLAKARAAFVENQSQERYWIWTITTTRLILDKAGKTLEQIPSVTIESPIRSDGKRCNAVVAWGDGIEPYLKNASADRRCTVEQEVAPSFRMEDVLANHRVTVQARSNSEITLAIRPDKTQGESEDAAKRCAGSLDGTIGLDPDSYFPKRVDLTVVNNGCERKAVEMEEHYAGSTVMAAGGYPKGAHIQYEYELQKDKTGNASRNFWIAAHRRLLQPFPKNLAGVIISGRNFKLSNRGQERQGLTEGIARASEVSAESMLKFEVPQ
jgi:hypothetical protein